MASLTKKFPSIKPQPLYEWLPSSYDMDKKLSTFRGEKWLSDQASFLMEMMKFQPNIRKEAYRKGLGDYKETALDPSKPEDLSDAAWKDYNDRVRYYDTQYIGLNGNVTQRVLSIGNPHGSHPTFGLGHSFGRGGDSFDIQGFAAGAAVSEDGTGVRKKQIYDFFMNFWDFGGSYKDYFHVGENDQYSASFFSDPRDLYSADKTHYRTDKKYDYTTGFESAQTIDRRYDAIPIFKRGTTWIANGTEYFNSYNDGKQISGMSWEDYQRFAPKDFTSSYFGRNPAILLDGTDEVPSLTGYDRMNPKNSNKTHFKEATEYFSTYISPRGKALTYNGRDDDGNDTYADVERAGFHDLMLDPDAPWNNNGTGTGWWADKNSEFEQMKAAFYIAILAVEARRRNLHAMTQWFGPHTQFQGFSNIGGTTVDRFFPKTVANKTGKYVPGSDDHMIQNFRNWYGDTCQDRMVGDQSGQVNPFWRSAEAPQFRAEFNNVFMTAFHEMGAFMTSFSGNVGMDYLYSQAEKIGTTDGAVNKLKAWMIQQFTKLMDPAKVEGTIFENIHPNKSEQGLAKAEFEKFLTTKKNYSLAAGGTYNAAYNTFADTASISANQGTINWTWSRTAGDIADSNGGLRKEIEDAIDDIHESNSSIPRNRISSAYWSALGSGTEFIKPAPSSVSNLSSRSFSGLGDKTDSFDSGMETHRTYTISGAKHRMSVGSTLDVSWTTSHTSQPVSFRYNKRDTGATAKGIFDRRNKPRSNEQFASTGSGSLTDYEGSWDDFCRDYRIVERKHYSLTAGTSTTPSTSAYHSTYYYKIAKNSNPPAADSDPPFTLYHPEHEYTQSHSDTISITPKSYDGATYADAVFREKYQLKATYHGDEHYNDDDGNGSIDPKKEKWSIGHDISLIADDADYTCPGGDMTILRNINAGGDYLDASQFRPAYEEFRQNAAKPYDDMSLATYRMERDRSTRGALSIEPYIDPTRYAHQWYRNKDAVQNVLGLASDPELKRLYEGGAVAELFREYSLNNTNFGTINPAATADYAKMINSYIASGGGGNGPLGMGSWHFTVGNLRRGIPGEITEQFPDGTSGIYANWSENWFHQYSDWNSSQIRNTEAIFTDGIQDIQGTAYDNVWGLRVAYMMRNTTAYSVGYIAFQQVVYRMKANQRKQEMEEYKDQKHEEERDKAMDEKKEMEKRSEFRSMMAEISQKRSQERARVKKMLMKEQKNRKEQASRGARAQNSKKA